VFERLLPHLDLLLYDLKHVDSEPHRRHTGLDNALILANLRRIADLPAPKLIVRVPVIPGFNADAASLSAIAAFVLSLGRRVSEINLLPYHTLGKSKYQALGRDYPWDDQPRLTDAEMQRLAAVVATEVAPAGTPVRIGG
jgi:pyruvate formate lyase activating enzyme